MEVDIESRSFGPLAVAEAVELTDRDLKALNTKDEPDRIKPMKLDGVALEGNRTRATLKPGSWNLIRLQPA